MDTPIAVGWRDANGNIVQGAGNTCALTGARILDGGVTRRLAENPNVFYRLSRNGHKRAHQTGQITELDRWALEAFRQATEQDAPKRPKKRAKPDQQDAEGD